MKIDPVRQPDEQALALTRRMMGDMHHAILAVVDPDTGHPHVSRIACQVGPDGIPTAVLSRLAAHTRMLQAGGKAGLMIEATAIKGDPMTHARLSMQVDARPAPDDQDRRARWLAKDPRATVYIDLPDFRFWQLIPLTGLLNAGFGAAFRLTPADMISPRDE